MNLGKELSLWSCYPGKPACVLMSHVEKNIFPPLPDPSHRLWAPLGAFWWMYGCDAVTPVISRASDSPFGADFLAEKCFPCTAGAGAEPRVPGAEQVFCWDRAGVWAAVPGMCVLGLCCSLGHISGPEGVERGTSNHRAQGSSPETLHGLFALLGFWQERVKSGS